MLAHGEESISPVPVLIFCCFFFQSSRLQVIFTKVIHPTCFKCSQVFHCDDDCTDDRGPVCICEANDCEVTVSVCISCMWSCPMVYSKRASANVSVLLMTCVCSYLVHKEYSFGMGKHIFCCSAKGSSSGKKIHICLDTPIHPVPLPLQPSPLCHIYCHTSVQNSKDCTSHCVWSPIAPPFFIQYLARVRRRSSTSIFVPADLLCLH
jgi:hypothetical protein